jgi:hypothetical protein
MLRIRSLGGPAKSDFNGAGIRGPVPGKAPLRTYALAVRATSFRWSLIQPLV